MNEYSFHFTIYLRMNLPYPSLCRSIYNRSSNISVNWPHRVSFRRLCAVRIASTSHVNVFTSAVMTAAGLTALYVRITHRKKHYNELKMPLR
jgi:hypothetical protein